MEMHAVEVTGTFTGHFYFGALFTVWGAAWIAEALLLPSPEGPAPLERGVWLPAMKLVLPMIAVWFEVPNRGWEPMDYMMGWAHIAAYSPFAVTGVVDLLARRGAIAERAGFVAYAFAMVNAAFVFWGHDHHGGVPHAAHNLLELTLLAAAGFALLELARPGAATGWFRRGALFGLGTWLFVLTWVLYRSGWDMADPLREAWVYVLFSWNAIVVTVLVATLAFVSTRRSARSGG